MAAWLFMKIYFIPMTLGIVFAFGLVLCASIAILRGDVSPYVPLISETGGKFPEAGLLSLFLSLSSSIGFCTLFLRFLIIDELNRSFDRRINILNLTSLIAGFLAFMGMVVVAAYPVTSVFTAHMIGSEILFICGMIYSVLQTALSYRMSPYYNGKKIYHIQLVSTIIITLTLIILLFMVYFGQDAWSKGYHSHWKGGKTPADKGFNLLLVHAIAEWVIAIFFVVFCVTCIQEFSQVCLHLRMQLLVEHTDEILHGENSAKAKEFHEWQ